DGKKNQTLGTIMGAGLGGLLGSQFGSGKGKLVGVALGSILGAYLGKELGTLLDEREKQAVGKQTTIALASAKDGETIQWNNPDTGAKAQITPSNTVSRNREIALVRKRDVLTPVNMTVIGRTYIVTKTANLRAGPGTGNPVVGSLKTGERFQAIGSVRNGEWVVVGEKNRVAGYVYGQLVGDAPALANITAVDLDARPMTDQQPALRKSINLDEIKKNEAVNLDAEGLIAENIAVQQKCRDMSVQVEKAGESAFNSFQACKSADGAWELL
ncbi:MAG: SH3 domain-containing protein, partial [Coleofasciculus sp. C2-GNP5-27]